MSFENRNYAFAGAFVEEFGRCGLKHVCICPGSRSAPLAISFAHYAGIRKWVHLDERSAAFFALGIAKYMNEPVALVCSSGTATVNFLPAIVEAHYSSIPLLVLTADRPSELLDWGALQTIDQIHMYGNNVKWSVNMPTPDTNQSVMAFVRSVAGRAFAMANEKPRGAVHLNFPFREPLEPANISTDLPESAAELQSQAYRGRSGKRPYLRSISAEGKIFSDEIKQLASKLASLERGLIICGPETNTKLAAEVANLAQCLDYPILADCLSQIRCGPHDQNMVIDYYDSFIGDKDLIASLVPQVVLRFGALPVSKPLTRYLEHHHSAYHILIDEEGWRDPFHLTSEIWHTDAQSLCSALSSLTEREESTGEWSNRWRNLAKSAKDAIQRELSEMNDMFEGKVFTELGKLLTADSLLFVGNSMPVRNMDTFFPSMKTPIQFMANRGASGIDGVVSSALGASAVSQERVVLVIGDISFYHDMNGLLAAKNFGLKTTIIVLNNNGGGIFSFLPHADYEEVFESYFATPHNLTFKAGAELYGLDYYLANNWETFRKVVKGSLKESNTTVIEVTSNQKSNVRLHRQIEEAVVMQIQQSEGEQWSK